MLSKRVDKLTSTCRACFQRNDDDNEKDEDDSEIGNPNFFFVCHEDQLQRTRRRIIIIRMEIEQGRCARRRLLREREGKRGE